MPWHLRLTNMHKNTEQRENKGVSRWMTHPKHRTGNTKGGSITVQFASCLTGLDYSVLQIKTKIVSCHTADSKPVKQEVNSTMILPTLLFSA
jgi:hypothetical protein